MLERLYNKSVITRCIPHDVREIIQQTKADIGPHTKRQVTQPVRPAKK